MVTTDVKQKAQEALDKIINEKRTLSLAGPIPVIGANLVSSTTLALLERICVEYTKARVSALVLVANPDDEALGRYFHEMEIAVVNVFNIWKASKKQAEEESKKGSPINIYGMSLLNLQHTTHHEFGHGHYAATVDVINEEESETAACNNADKMLPFIYMSSYAGMGEMGLFKEERVWHALYNIELANKTKFGLEQASLLGKGIMSEFTTTLGDFLKSMKAYRDLDGWIENGSVAVEPDFSDPESVQETNAPMGEGDPAYTFDRPDIPDSDVWDNMDYGDDNAPMDFTNDDEYYDAPAPEPPLPTPTHTPQAAPNPSLLQWGANLLSFLGNVMFDVCHFDGQGNMTAPQNIVTPIRVIAQHESGTRITHYETLDNMGRVTTKEIGPDGMISGRTFNNGVVGYILTFSGPGGTFKRTVLSQNANKIGNNGQLTKSAMQAKQGVRIAWVLDSNIRQGGFLASVTNGRYAKFTG